MLATREGAAGERAGEVIFELRVPIRTQSESNGRDHWRAKAARAKAQRITLAWAWRERVLNGRVPSPRVQDGALVVLIVRIAPRKLDDDNARSALKAVRDQVAVELGLPTTKQGIADDRDPRVRWEYGQERGAPGVYEVRIEVRR